MRAGKPTSAGYPRSSCKSTTCCRHCPTASTSQTSSPTSSDIPHSETSPNLSRSTFPSPRIFDNYELVQLIIECLLNPHKVAQKYQHLDTLAITNFLKITNLVASFLRENY